MLWLYKLHQCNQCRLCCLYTSSLLPAQCVLRYNEMYVSPGTPCNVYIACCVLLVPLVCYAFIINVLPLGWLCTSPSSPLLTSDSTSSLIAFASTTSLQLLNQYISSRHLILPVCFCSILHPANINNPCLLYSLFIPQFAISPLFHFLYTILSLSLSHSLTPSLSHKVTGRLWQYSTRNHIPVWTH